MSFRHHTLCLTSSLVLAVCALSSAVPCQSGNSLPFIENQGQWSGSHGFLAARGHSMVKVYTDGFELIRLDPGSAPPEVLRLTFIGGGEKTSLHGREVQQAYFNYHPGKGQAPVTRVRAWRGVDYRDLHPGVQLWLRFEDGLLEYDLEVQSEAALSQISIQCDGARSIELAEDGALLIAMGQDQIRQAPPLTWIQNADGSRRLVSCSYRILGEHQFGFEVIGWNGEGNLVIDPGLEWSTFLGGSSPDVALDVITDPAGVIWVAGDTFSADFPASTGALQGPSDAFVARYEADGSLAWASYLGGSGEEDGQALALGPGGSVLVAGITGSPDFPVTAGTLDQTFVNGEAFVARLSADGTTLEWATFLGGGLGDEIWAMQSDASGQITLAGQTESDDFPTTAGAYDRIFNGSPWDLFITRFDATAENILWSTLIGGSAQEEIRDLAVDSAGNVTAGGWTSSSDFPTTPGAYSQTFLGGGSNQEDGVVFQVSADGSDLNWSTFLGGTDEDEVLGLVLDANENVVLSGWTSSTDFPLAPGSYDVSANGDKDAFLAALSSDGSTLIYGSMFGGSGLDEAQALTLNGSGAAILAGNTASADLPVTLGCYDSVYNGGGFGADAFVAVIDMGLNGRRDLIYTTYFGGAGGIDAIQGLATTPSGSAILAGFTSSDDFHTTPGAAMENPGGSVDAFLSVLDLAPGPILSQTTLFRGQTADLTVINLASGETVHFVYSLAGQGNGPCVSQLGGLCLDVRSPVTVLGQADADAGGTAVFAAMIPNNAPLVPVTTQALVVRGTAGGQSVKSNPVNDFIRP